MQRHPGTLHSLHAAGHEIGNHSQTNRRLYLRLGFQINWLRPRQVSDEFERAQAVVIARNWEWDAQTIVTHVLAYARPRAIVCLHDGRDIRPDPDISQTLAAMRLLVPELQKRGYRFETVTELLRPDADIEAEPRPGIPMAGTQA